MMGSLTISKKGKAAGATALAAALILAGSMAYFTDRESATATATAGTVDLALTNGWRDIANFNPGDSAAFGYKIANIGNKSVDVCETIVLKSSVAMDADDQAEFELYRSSDIELAANGSYVPKKGAEPITTDAARIVSSDGKTIKYVLDEYTLNGTGLAAEVESGINAVEKTSDYSLVFRNDASNDFQGAELSVELLAQAKQHRNTDSDTWTTVITDSVTMGGETVDAVPAAK